MTHDANWLPSLNGHPRQRERPLRLEALADRRREDLLEAQRGEARLRAVARDVARRASRPARPRARARRTSRPRAGPRPGAARRRPRSPAPARTGSGTSCSRSAATTGPCWSRASSAPRERSSSLRIRRRIASASRPTEAISGGPVGVMRRLRSPAPTAFMSSRRRRSGRRTQRWPRIVTATTPIASITPRISSVVRRRRAASREASSAVASERSMRCCRSPTASRSSLKRTRPAPAGHEPRSGLRAAGAPRLDLLARGLLPRGVAPVDLGERAQQLGPLAREAADARERHRGLAAAAAVGREELVAPRDDEAALAGLLVDEVDEQATGGVARRGARHDVVAAVALVLEGVDADDRSRPRRPPRG